MSVNFLGVGSGLDLQTMLDGLVKVATEPKVQQLGAKEAVVNASISGLGSVKSALSEFQESVESLKSSSLYGQKSASITQPEGGDVVSVSAETNAVEGTYNITVKELATGSQGKSTVQTADTSVAEGNSGQLTFSADGQSFNIAVDAGDSLDDIVAKVNSSEDNFGVSAVIVDGYLIYKSDVTGLNNDLSVTNDSAALDKYSTDANGGLPGSGGVSITSSAKSAKIDVDGTEITSTSNTFENAVTGLTITASKVDTEAAVVTVGKNGGAISSAIKEMADKYNDLIGVINKQTGSMNDDDEFVAGPMFGSSLLRQIDTMLGDAMSSMVDGADSNLNSMYAVGLELQSDGTISVDDTRLNEALSSNFDKFEALFSDTNSTSFASTLSTRLEGYLEYDGVIDSVEDGFKQQLETIEQQYNDHIEYIQSYQDTLKKQFAALDSTMATLNATMQYMSGQLAQLSQLNSSQ